MVFVTNLKALRTRAPLSQRDLAEQAGLTYSTIARLETLKQEVRPSTLRKLARALGCKPSDLIDQIG